MFLRLATGQDALEMSKIHAQSWKSAYRGLIHDHYLDHLDYNFWYGNFQKVLGKPGGMTGACLFVGDVMAGASVFGKSRDKGVDSSWGEIYSLYLLEEYWGKGMGQAFISFVHAELLRMGYQNLSLWAIKNNYRAEKAYFKYGFQKDGQEMDFEIEGQTIHEERYILTKELA